MCVCRCVLCSCWYVHVHALKRGFLKHLYYGAHRIGTHVTRGTASCCMSACSPFPLVRAHSCTLLDAPFDGTERRGCMKTNKLEQGSSAFALSGCGSSSVALMTICSSPRIGLLPDTVCQPPSHFPLGHGCTRRWGMYTWQAVRITPSAALPSATMP